MVNGLRAWDTGGGGWIKKFCCGQMIVWWLLGHKIIRQVDQLSTILESNDIGKPRTAKRLIYFSKVGMIIGEILSKNCSY